MTRKFNPKVSIIIPVYNGSNYVKEAIDSALSQTYKNTEVIVVNDGSTDEGKTDRICRSYGDKIRYFPKENGGVASALNMGIEKMEGEYFSWLSHDDIYYPDKIQKQVDVLTKTSKKDRTIIFSNVEYIDESSNMIYKTKYEDKYKRELLTTGIFPVLNGLANGCSLLIPKKCFLESGLFDESLRTTNDYDMWFRLFRIYSIEFVKDVLIKYRFHPKQGTKTIPTYRKESDKLWLAVLKSITEKEIRSFKMSFFAFYYDMYLKTKNALLTNAYTFVFEKAKKYYTDGIPEISVIMPCFNSRKYLKAAIDSILNQTFPNFELIIVDDFSTDSTYSILEKYKDKDFRVIVVKNKYKKGIPGAMNTGIGLSRGKYITRMDSDDLSLPERLERQSKFLDKNKEFDLCSVNTSTFGKYEIESIYTQTDAPIECLFLWSNPIPNAPTMFRAELIMKNDLRFRSYVVAEDYDFLCRTILLGRPAILNEVLYKYRVHSKSVFQRNKEDVSAMSTRANTEFIRAIIKTEVPQFHSLLTTFRNKLTVDENPSTLDLINWINRLLKESRKVWNWNEKEYNAACEYSEQVIIGYLAESSDNIKILRNEIGAMQSEIKGLMTLLERYRTDSERLTNIENSIFWKCTWPLRKIREIFYLFLNQGVVLTSKNILSKLKKKLYK